MNTIMEDGGPYMMGQLPNMPITLLWHNAEIIGEVVPFGGVWRASIQAEDLSNRVILTTKDQGEAILQLWDSRHEAHVSAIPFSS